MRIIDCFFANYIETEVKKVPKDEITNLESMITQIFMFALIWSIGTTVNLEGRQKFDKWIREKMASAGIEFPEEKMVYDYKF
jgi:dynein heavy chain